MGTLEELKHDLASAQRDLKIHKSTGNRRLAQATVNEIKARIAAYPTTVDDLLRRVDCPAGLRQALDAARARETLPYGEQGPVGEFRRALYDPIVQDLLDGERQELTPSVVPAEIPPPERQAEAGSARGAEGQERTDVVVNEEDVAAYADGIRSGKMEPGRYATLLADMTDERRDRKVETLRAAVDRLAQEVQKPNADPTAATRTKENLKKLGLALAGAGGLVTLASILVTLKIIEGVIGEAFEIAKS